MCPSTIRFSIITVVALFSLFTVLVPLDAPINENPKD
jgi:hypothetical protein